MNIPTQVKPAAWGVVGGAVAAMIIGFSWGGWVTGGTSHKAGAAQAADAVVQVLVPLCVAKAEAEPEKLIALKKESSYMRDSFVVKAGWVSTVSEKYRSDVAKACATTVVEAMDAAAKKPS